MQQLDVQNAVAKRIAVHLYEVLKSRGIDAGPDVMGPLTLKAAQVVDDAKKDLVVELILKNLYNPKSVLKKLTDEELEELVREIMVIVGKLATSG